MITYTFVLLVYYAKSISVLVRQSVCLSVCPSPKFQARVWILAALPYLFIYIIIMITYCIYFTCK